MQTYQLDIDHIKSYFRYATWLNLTDIGRRYEFNNPRAIYEALRKDIGFGSDTEKVIAFLLKETRYNPAENYTVKK